MPTTVQHIKGSELPPRVTRPLRIRPEAIYTLTIEAKEESGAEKTRKLMDLFKVGAGAYDRPEDIDASIRNLRDSWD